MSSPTISAPNPVVPLDVLAFAEEQGVAAYIPPLIDWLRDILPAATRLILLLEDDPEFPDRHILFEIDAPVDVSGYVAAKQQWSEGLSKHCPTPLMCTFRLHINPAG